MLMASFDSGGAERTALTLGESLIQQGHWVAAGSVRPGGELRETFQSRFNLTVDGLANSKFDPLAAFRISGLLADESIDVLIVVDAARNAMCYGFVGAVLCKRRVARISWCKSIPNGQAGKFAGLLRWLTKLRLAQVVVCTSKRQRKALVARGVGRRRLALIRNGIDLERFATAKPTDMAIATGKKIIIQVANVMGDKDHATLLSAIKLLADRRDDFHLVLAGRGTDSPVISRLVKKAGLEQKVTLLGYRADIAELLAAADVYVLASKSEVFPVSVLEAMAAGLPVVASDLPAYQEMLTDGREALLAAVGSGEALAGELEKLLDDADLRTKMGRAGRARSGRFSNRRMTESFTRLVKLLVR